MTTEPTQAAALASLVNRFLSWKLPDNFNPDGGITFTPVRNAGTAHEFTYTPVGTNLFDATQARQMIEHLLADDQAVIDYIVPDVDDTPLTPDDEARMEEGWQKFKAAIGVANLQAGVAPWMQECFGPEISADKLERGDRLLEEVLELLQSGDYPRERIAALTSYTYNRPKGEPAQEVGGVMITLAAYCLAHALDMHEAGSAELERITQPEMVEKIRAKQATKPTGSALPVPSDL